jgi:hypothetical protein
MPSGTDRAIGTNELRRRILTHLQTHADGVRRLFRSACAALDTSVEGAAGRLIINWR